MHAAIDLTTLKDDSEELASLGFHVASLTSGPPLSERDSEWWRKRRAARADVSLLSVGHGGTWVAAKYGVVI
jgi:hypothetical protein